MKEPDKIKLLLSQIADDNPAAFKEFYDLFYIRVYRFAGYLTRYEPLKEEIVSDVFFSMWQIRKKLPGIENVEAYLYTVTRNKALYYLNRLAREMNTPVEQIPPELITIDETPENIVLNEELREAINKAVAELPVRCKLIFLMAKEEGLKYREIADILSLSEKTVNAQMVTAIKKLAEALRKYINIVVAGFSIFFLR